MVRCLAVNLLSKTYFAWKWNINTRFHLRPFFYFPFSSLKRTVLFYLSFYYVLHLYCICIFFLEVSTIFLFNYEKREIEKRTKMKTCINISFPSKVRFRKKVHSQASDHVWFSLNLFSKCPREKQFNEICQNTWEVQILRWERRKGAHVFQSFEKWFDVCSH